MRASQYISFWKKVLLLSTKKISIVHWLLAPDKVQVRRVVHEHLLLRPAMRQNDRLSGGGIGRSLRLQVGAYPMYSILRESMRAAAADGLGGSGAAGVLGAEFYEGHPRLSPTGRSQSTACRRRRCWVPCRSSRRPCISGSGNIVPGPE